MENKKILPVNYPIITSYPAHANILSCVSQYENSIQWFYNHYLQLLAYVDFSRGYYVDFCAPIPWRSCPWIHAQRITRELIGKKWETITDFIIDCIDLDCYVYLYLDQFYIAAAAPYQKYHLAHDTFIFGYDLQNQTFDVADFYKYSKYCYTKATFSQIGAAYQTLDLSNIPDNLQGIVLLKPVPYAEYQFDIQVMAELLQDYLLARKSSKSYTDGYRLDIGAKNDRYYYGMDIYRLLPKHLEYYLNGQGPLDIRAFHVILDHKTLMLARIKYLIDNNYLHQVDSIYEDYQKVVKQAVNLRSLALKAILSKEGKTIQSIMNYLPYLVDGERMILEQLLAQLAFK
ncbi:MAG TPA: hypothetical protein VHY08_19975 [Bacillota bacterium]|nr:hypothetical protein [Bacillota bacterium]